MFIRPSAVEIRPAEVNLDGVAMNAAHTSNWLSLKVGAQMVLEFDITNASGIALPVVIYLNSQRNQEASTTWRRELISVEAAPAAGVVNSDLYRRSFTYTTQAAVATERFYMERAVTFPKLQIYVPIVAGAGATDLLSCHVRYIW